jgi:hypothetical protein
MGPWARHRPFPVSHTSTGSHSDQAERARFGLGHADHSSNTAPSSQRVPEVPPRTYRSKRVPLTALLSSPRWCR